MATTQNVTLITAFEVPPDADEAFIAAWEATAGALHRALRADVSFRFVDIARADSQRATPGGEMPFPAHQSMYEVVREHGTPDVHGGVVRIDPCEVRDADDERFLADWDRAREFFARQRGYLGARLHRSLEPADLRFVEIARWSSPLMFARARDRPDFATVPFPSHPALYQVIRD